MPLLLKEVQSSLLEILGQVIEAIPGFALALVLLFITRFAANLVQRIISRVAANLLRSRSLKALLMQTSFVGTWVIGILMASVTAFPGLGLGDIIALLGLGSVAIGFAFQDIFKNFLAGILLLLQEPFQLGDQIVVNDFEGTVQNITLRSTQIRTYQGEDILLPNSLVFTSPVHVLTAQQTRRTDLSLGLDYNTPLKQALQVLDNAVSKVSAVQRSPEPRISITGFGDSSIDFVIRYWTASSAQQVDQARTEVILSIKAACDRANFSIPYPIRSVYLYEQDQFEDAAPRSSTSLSPSQTSAPAPRPQLMQTGRATSHAAV